MAKATAPRIAVTPERALRDILMYLGHHGDGKTPAARSDLADACRTGKCGWCTIKGFAKAGLKE